ncbi:MAG: hypothetical protein NC548_41175 [Lachnospiraceae bacterium]|nr:hypothetical protein [Lachnospiraceae bacterium]
MKGGEIIRYKYKHSCPSLYIIVTPSESKVSIEFSGKILGDKYPNLINKETISECIDRINTLGTFSLDKHQVIDEGIVGQCDVTVDIDGLDVDRFTQFIHTHLSTKKWAVGTYYGGGITIHKTVSTSRYQRRLTVYNKEAEMQKQSNLDFLSQIENNQAVTDYFKGKTRFEFNIKSMEAIRDELNIESNSVRCVLNATSNPIRKAVLSAIKLAAEEKQVKTLRDFERCAVLEKYDFDISKIREAISPFYDNRNSVNKTIAVYRDLAQGLRPVDYDWLYNILNQVA